MIKDNQNLFYRLAWLTLILSFIVIILGAYVRLSEAGLSCPDWPGCYGNIIIDEIKSQYMQQNLFPNQPLEIAKAWKEMFHRYLASLLGILVLILMILAWKNKKLLVKNKQPVILTFSILVLVIIQALLGMWTVTWQLHPIIVTAHLLGGFTTFSLLIWLVLTLTNYNYGLNISNITKIRKFVIVGLILLIIQIFLGSWTSTNYASLVCTDFPTCQGYWLPPSNIGAIFSLQTSNNISYAGGILPNDIRVTIQMVHRFGALVVFLYLCLIIWQLLNIRKSNSKIYFIGLAIAFLLCTQLFLGVMNVIFMQPLFVAVAHNGIAALLLGTMVVLYYLLRPISVNKKSLLL